MMHSEAAEEALLTRYLLGELSEAEETRVEDRAFAESAYLGRLEAAEADLIDSYVRGRLSEAERHAFERRFLTSPTRRGKVEFARALVSVAAEQKLPEPAPRPMLTEVFRAWSTGLRLAASFAALICIAGPLWLLYQNVSMRSQLAAFARKQQELRPVSPQQQATSPAPAIASLLLAPGVSRSETTHETLVLTSSTQIAHFAIQLERRDEYPRYRAELRSRGGEELLTLANLTRHRSGPDYAVSFDVPASALAPGEYELSLKGMIAKEAVSIGYYYFGIRSK